jgi:ABC-type sugar transport system substrate-binding protein
MIRRRKEEPMSTRLGAIAILVAAIGVTAGAVASRSNGAAQAQPTIGLIVPGAGSPIASTVENGGQAAATALGDQLAITAASDAPTQISTINSLIAQRAAAIAIDTDEGPATVKQVLPALARARAAGIPTLSYEQRYTGSVWVSQSSPAQYAHALADALASQMRKRGRYMIVPCRPAESIVKTWLKATKPYVRRQYPHMHRIGVVYGGTGNGVAGTLALRHLLRKHPHLRGFDFLCPSEAYTGPPQLAHLHDIGKVFSAGNGDGCPPLYTVYANSVRAGTTEIVCAGDPTNLGYLTIWAADHLARSNTLAFTPGSYDVGGPIGTVQYYSRHEELRLGQPLTITKANVDEYSG